MRESKVVVTQAPSMGRSHFTATTTEPPWTTSTRRNGKSLRKERMDTATKGSPATFPLWLGPEPSHSSATGPKPELTTSTQRRALSSAEDPRHLSSVSGSRDGSVPARDLTGPSSPIPAVSTNSIAIECALSAESYLFTFYLLFFYLLNDPFLLTK